MRSLVLLFLCLAGLASETPSQHTAPAKDSGAPPLQLGFLLDADFRYTYRHMANFDFRGAELNLSAFVDGWFSLFSVIRGDTAAGFVKETFLMTTNLPYHLTVRGGRMFANFGRLPHWHDHELPFATRLPSLARFFSGEAQADGLEVMYQFPLSFFLQTTLGAYNKIGSKNFRVPDRNFTGGINGRHLSSLTYLFRTASTFTTGRASRLDLGISQTVVPREYYIAGERVNFPPPTRSLTGVDITFFMGPLANLNAWNLTWGVEGFFLTEQNPIIEETDSTRYRRDNDPAVYTFIEWRPLPAFSVTPYFDYATQPDDPETKIKSFGLALNLFPGPQSRLRLDASGLNVSDTKVGKQEFPGLNDWRFILQWTLGAGMHVHTFPDR